MIDTFSIVLSHGLLAIMLWRLLHRPDLDTEDGLNNSDDGSPQNGAPRGAGFRQASQAQPSRTQTTQRGFRDRA